jgi:membrane protease subunit HflK
MAWNSDDNDGPWGRKRGNAPKNSGGGDEIDQLLKRLQEKLSSFLPFFNKSPRMVPLILLVGLGLWLSTGFFNVKEGEQAAVLRFGRLVRVSSPGLRYHLPAPIEKAQVVRVSAINIVNSGFQTTSEKLFQGQDSANLMLTGDENIVTVRFTVQWFVKDLAEFLFNDPDPNMTVKYAAESAVREVIAKTTLANALTVSKDQIVQDSVAMLQKMLDKYKVGIKILKMNLEEVNPPMKVREAFLDVQRARSDEVRLINEARAYENSVIPPARGQAQQLIQEAEADRQSMIAAAQGEASRYASVLKEYEAAPQATLMRRLIEVNEKVLKGRQKVIVGDSRIMGNTTPFLPLADLTKRSVKATESSPSNTDGASR